jgi:hypothetical protein
LFVSSVLFVFSYHSPNVLDTPRIYWHNYRVHVRIPAENEDGSGRYWQQTCLCSVLSRLCMLWDLKLLRFVVRHRRFGIKYHSHLQRLSSTKINEGDRNLAFCSAICSQEDRFVLRYLQISRDMSMFWTIIQCQGTYHCCQLTFTVIRNVFFLNYHTVSRGIYLFPTDIYCHKTSLFFLTIIHCHGTYRCSLLTFTVMRQAFVLNHHIMSKDITSLRSDIYCHKTRLCSERSYTVMWQTVVPYWHKLLWHKPLFWTIIQCQGT